MVRFREAVRGRGGLSVAIHSNERRSPSRYEPPLMSFEDFHDWLDEDRRAEWVDGEIVEMSPSNLGHQDILTFLTLWLGTYIDRFRLGRLYLPPTLMHLPTRPSGREPDLLFVANQNLHRLQRTYVDGPADLVVEIVSPDSIVRDGRDKLLEYEQAGVPEYWIIDELRDEARFFVLQEDGRYRRIEPSPTGIYTSTVLPGLSLRIEWLWRRPLPTLDEARADLPS
ncbi:MAG: Uma2 family endonuclease [Chloroflexi bacterium]|nr:Uma2 family endonuclease [Chloroflexota bacterium]